MKVLLISANTETVNMPVLPLGLACVAAACERAGHEVYLLDLITGQDVETDVRRAVSGFQPDVIGISVRNIDDQCVEDTQFLLAPVKKIVACCRETSGAPVVLGGAGYSIFPQSALSYLGADMGIKGEGEYPFATLLDRIEQGSSFEGIPGLFLPERGAVQKPERAPVSLESYPLPVPDVHLKIPPALKDQDVWMPVQSRRGCPMDCAYCSTASIEGRVLRQYPPEKIVAMVKDFVAAGIRRFYFVDNLFNLPLSYAKTLCTLLREIKADIQLRCILYPWKVDEVLAGLMAQAGMTEAALGFESGAPEILGNLNKKFTPADVKKVSGLLRKHHIRRVGFLLLGGPGETQETVRKSFDFVKALDLDGLKVTTGIRIYPDTPLARRAVREGIVDSHDSLLYPRFYLSPTVKNIVKPMAEKEVDKHPNWFM